MISYVKPIWSSNHLAHQEIDGCLPGFLTIKLSKPNVRSSKGGSEQITLGNSMHIRRPSSGCYCSSANTYRGVLHGRGFPGSSAVKNLTGKRRLGFSPWVGKIPWRRAWQSIPWKIPWTEEPGRLQAIESQSQT